jgi:hypothetical protein
MAASKHKSGPAHGPQPAAPPAPATGKPLPRRTANIKVLTPDARWQRFQRYVWDRKKG